LIGLPSLSTGRAFLAASLSAGASFFSGAASLAAGFSEAPPKLALTFAAISSSTPLCAFASIPFELKKAITSLLSLPSSLANSCTLIFAI
jgi:hypothetical protein